MDPSNNKCGSDVGENANKGDTVADSSQNSKISEPMNVQDLGLAPTTELSHDSEDDTVERSGQSSPTAAKNSSSTTVATAPTSPLHSERKHQVVCERWTRITELLHATVISFVLALSLRAARNPKTCISSIVFLSFALLGVGFFTNFEINVDENELYAPFGSVSLEHKDWLIHESGYKDSARAVVLIFHKDGENVLGMDEMRKVFQATETVRNTKGYEQICQEGTYWDEDDKEFTCRIVSTTRAWNHDYELFDSQVQSSQDLISTLSLPEYPGGARKDPKFVMGNLEYDEDNVTISYIPAYFVWIMIPDKGDESLEFEALVSENLAALRTQWEQVENKLQMEFYTDRSYQDEFQRAIHQDMYLVPVIAFVMCGFASSVFYKNDRVRSRCLLGVGSVFTITMALFSGFGFLFLCGVPFSSMTQLLIFIVFGIGLDDCFIILGAYFRVDPSKDLEERVHATMVEIGPSVTATTLTTMSAFVLGLMSSVPAIYWLCLYAFPTVFLVYIYTITMFIAMVILDERRIDANRKDCCICCFADQSQPVTREGSNEPSKHIADKVMIWYGNQLMKPVVKAIVLAVFASFFAYCAYRTTMLTQEFDVKELLPDGSYVTKFLIAMDDYQEKTYAISIIFRDVDQSDPAIQQEMRDFIDDVEGLDAFGEEPPFCWVRDFKRMNETAYYDDVVDGLTFQQKVNFALSIPALKEVYGDDIVLDDEGNIVSSRCHILATNTHLDHVNTTIQLLQDQRSLTNEQTINKGRKREAFFTYSYLYPIWEFYAIAVDELISTTVFSVVAVNAVAFIFIPHWTAVVFLVPTISVVFIDMMGVLQMAGLHINAVTYVCLLISIGLIVDFLMHVLFRYVECRHQTREERVKDTLETMGASILLGGLSTFLGALPLVFCTSTILRTVFTSFFSMVVLGVSHGLIFLPVLLSLVGPLPEGSSSESPELKNAKKAVKEEKTSNCETSDPFDASLANQVCNSSELEMEVWV